MRMIDFTVHYRNAFGMVLKKKKHIPTTKIFFFKSKYIPKDSIIRFFYK